MLSDVWLLARWIAQNCVFCAFILLADLLAGAAVVCLIERHARASLPPALRAAASVAFGTGLAAVVLFWLGMAGWLAPAAPLVVTAALALGGAAAIHRLGAWKRVFAFPRALAVGWPQWLPALLVAAPGAVILVDLMWPVLEFDSTTYHMTAARLYRETHSLGYFGALRYNAHPQLSVLLLLRHWSILGDNSLAKMVNLEYGFMLLLCLVYAARELGWKAGWIPAALFVLSSPLVIFAAQLEYADLPLTAYTTVAGCLLFHQLRRRADTTAAAALALGLAASVKLQGHVVAACLAAGFVVASRSVRRLPLIGLIVALVCGGWWLRSWIHTGSPAYPFFVRDHPDVAGMLRNDATYGRGHDLRAFLSIPWHMLVGPPQAFADPFVFGSAGLLLVAAVAAAALRSRKAPPREIVFLLSSFAVYLGFWFSTSQVMRYLVTLLPLAAILFLWLLIRAGIPRRASLAVSLLLAVLPIYSLRVASRSLRNAEIPPVAYAGREQAMAAALPFYLAVRELNRHAQPGDKTYLLFGEDLKFYARTRTWGDWYGDLNYFWLARGTRSAEDLVVRLKSAGFRWLVVPRSRARRSASIFDWDFAGSAFVDSDVELPGVKTICSERRFAVYQLW